MALRKTLFRVGSIEGTRTRHPQDAEFAEAALEHARRHAKEQPMTRDEAIRLVLDAIRNEGPAPKHHRMIMSKHRAEWPMLWSALDALVSAADNEQEQR